MQQISKVLGEIVSECAGTIGWEESTHGEAPAQSFLAVE
jgi:hypothetical protein